ncbi:hypothetical protein C7M84_015202 [Penaeus vannamei]|uniref:Uncharacterized protein n=1 Tax=Penaeus vannamei TaxID=6689 RepID=A0A3R7MPF1_PENVA|nr:proline-rich protein 2-like [Penaeus vannamei]XP_027226379.1 proline-rich protein 2-like [Penaeus vannamei]ROT66750.1 hypothetical protein C7M84_015202 [Penaeus vannamei]
MSQDYPSTVSGPRQTAQRAQEQSDGSCTGKKAAQVTVMMIMIAVFFVIMIVASPRGVSEGALDMLIAVAVNAVFVLVCYKICKCTGGIQESQEENQQNAGEIPAGRPASPPQAPNRAPESRPATHTYTLLNSLTVGGNNSYPGRKDFYPSGSPRQTPPTGASSSASYNPYNPYPTAIDSLPRAPEEEPPPSYEQIHPSGHIPAGGPTAGTPIASAPELDPPPPYAPPPYEK